MISFLFDDILSSFDLKPPHASYFFINHEPKRVRYIRLESLPRQCDIAEPIFLLKDVPQRRDYTWRANIDFEV